MGQHPAKKQARRSDLLQPLSLPRPQPGRAILQSDQAMSWGGDALRQLAANYLAFVQLAISSPSSMHVERHDHSAAGQAALPIATFSVPTPSTPHSILSPGEISATPAGVPVMLMSPAPISTCCESFQMISGTLQISSERSPFCRSVPLTESQILPFAGWPIFAAGCSAEQGAEWSKDLPISQGRAFLPAASCRSRR